jgi:GGDEF domain-containing protein
VGLDGRTIPIGASIGVAITRDPTLAPVRLLAVADSDMYRVKATHRSLGEAA